MALSNESARLTRPEAGGPEILASGIPGSPRTEPYVFVQPQTLSHYEQALADEARRVSIALQVAAGTLDTLTRANRLEGGTVTEVVGGLLLALGAHAEKPAERILYPAAAD